ncbi:MAG: UDP-glucose 4-epimerase GalE, partial [Bacteroidales bacterium]|nr:UDP-glucose 4-epimerase GalE [Bacteroidales bacterium]
GATGYIGSHVAVELVNAGYNVIGVDNFSNSTPKVLDGIEKILGKRIDFMEVDCTDMEAFSKVFEQYPDIEAAIHFAAYKAVGESVAQPVKYYRNNLDSLVNLIELMTSKAKGANIVFSSSATVYGQPSDDELPIKESTPLQPATSPYGRTKQIAEDILQDCVKAYSNLNVTALRYFNPIGAHPSAHIGELPNGVPNNLVPFITQTAAGIRECLSVFGNDYNTPDGSCIRDYIYVVDLAKAHVKAVDKMLQEGIRWNVFNLGTGKGLSVLELVNAFIKATGVNLNYKIAERRAGDVEQCWANPSKANKELGWSADTPIEEVLLSAWNWQKTL